MFLLVVDSLRLFSLARSRRLQHIIKDELHVTVIPHQEPPGYEFDVVEMKTTIRKALDAAKQPAKYRNIDPESVERFITNLSKDSCGHKFSIHPEVALLSWLHRNNPDALPFIGVTKLSCAACHYYFHAANNSLALGGRPFATMGTHGKFYRSWVLPPDTPPEVRDQFVRSLQDVLVEECWMRRSGSQITHLARGRM